MRDTNLHYFNLLKFKKDDFNRRLKEIAKSLADTGYEIVLLPDRGVSFEIAKEYKRRGEEK